jgi:hypothetical protein
MLNGANGGGNLVRSHASITKKEHLLVAGELVNQGHGINDVRVTTFVVLPNMLIQTVMKIVKLKVFKLAVGGAK